VIITTLFAHMEKEAYHSVGDKLSTGCAIGLMGDTGFSALAHVHMGNCEGYRDTLFHLSDFESGEAVAVPRQLNYFIDDYFFQAPIKVTVPFACHEYQKEYNKVHSGYDLSTTKKWPWPFFWNRSMPGMVVGKGFDKGYGNYILIVHGTEGEEI